MPGNAHAGSRHSSPAGSGGGGGGTVNKYSTLIGDGSSLSYTVTHNLNTMAITVACWEQSSPYELVFPSIYEVSGNPNEITLTFASAPATNSIMVVVMG